MGYDHSADILRNTYSEADLYGRADILKRFFEHLFFGAAVPDNGDRATLLRAYYAGSNAELLCHVEAIIEWGAEVLAGFTPDNLYTQMTEIKDMARVVQKLTLYVPVHLEAKQVERIGVWCRAYIRPDILLDLKIDPEAVGGCKFAYNNVFSDFSFSYFEKKSRQRAVSLLRSYEA